MSNLVRKNKSILLVFLGIFIITMFILLRFTKSEVIENVTDFQVGFDSELIYTINVDYDGKDRNGQVSSNGNVVNIDSDYIYVEDVLPEGLIFERFGVSGDLNTVIGAYPRDGSNNVCRGYVVNDSTSTEDKNSNHGLHYDPNTRKVNFKIKNLQAGCRIEVVIVTRTPSTIEGNRKDFYNTAIAWEESQMAYSNMVHAWIQKATTETKKVTYQLITNPSDGTEVPANAKAPQEQKYGIGSIVGLASEPKLDGYVFSGWRPVNPITLEILNGKFTMPNSDVILQGYFTELSKYNVSYKIADDSPIPEGYVLPGEKQYYENSDVKLDSMKNGDVFNGYVFLGWDIEGIEVSDDGIFTMPAHDVEIIGRWEQVKYKVIYDFYDGVRPPNYQEILDSLNSNENTYAPGEKVKLPIVEDIAATGNDNGYHFQGWYKEDNFVMPAEDVIVYGEWMTKRKTFAPTITKKITNKKDYYLKGDIVEYSIVVTNNESYEIKNVLVKEHNENAQFLTDDNGIYNIKSSRIVEISSIPAHSNVIVKATYNVTENDIGTIDNVVEIVGASADDSDLDTSEEAKENYKATASFDIWPELKISKKVSNEDSNGKIFQFHITSDKGYDSWLNLTNNEEQILYLEPNDTYYVKEVVPQEYTLESVTGDISGNGESIEVKLGEKYSVEFTNKHHRKPYYHSDGRVSNEVKDVTDGRPDNPEGDPSYTSLTVQKVWIGDSEDERPASVSVQLYRDDKPYGSPITLSEENKWTYRWKGLNGGYTWVVGEVDVPDGYTSSVIQSGTTVTITNTYDEDIPDPEEPTEGIITIYFKAINGYFDIENYLTTNSFTHKNYVDEKYNPTDLISLDIPINENGEFIISSTDIPTSSAYAGYVNREFWQSIIPTKGMVVKNGDTFVVKYFMVPSNPSTSFVSEGSDISIRFVWNDKGFESERPKEATVTLVNAYDYENYNVFDTVILNDENNWSYEWKGLEYSTWQFETSIDIAGHSDIYDVRVHHESDSDIVITYTYFALIDD